MSSQSPSVPASPVAPIAWLDWGVPAFDRARQENKPVLLSITASWCHGCAVMDRVSYTDPAVAALVDRRFVAVRVDADRRPDVNDRYNLDGWPTTAALTASGEILTGSTYLPAEALRAMLQDVVDAYDTRGPALHQRAMEHAAARQSRARGSARALQPDLSATAWIARRVIEDCDPAHGGFGRGGKFLHIAALSAALDELERTGDAELAQAITRTLDGMADGGIRDAVDGGVFRYVSGADWTRPHTEKMLDDQVGAAVLFLEAARVFGHDRWRAMALDLIAFVRRTLADDGQHLFFASQAADDAYYQLQSEGLRRTMDPPLVDRTTYTDVTARAAAAWMRAGTLLADVTLAEAGARALDRVIALTYQPGEGVAHWHDGQARVRGLLTDQVHASWALLALHEATDNPTWSMAAEELMRTALRTSWDEATGSFLDRARGSEDAIGLLAEPVTPLATNCLAARVLARLSRLTGDVTLQQRALDSLRAFTASYREEGLFGAPYALAVADVLADTRS